MDCPLKTATNLLNHNQYLKTKPYHSRTEWQTWWAAELIDWTTAPISPTAPCPSLNTGWTTSTPICGKYVGQKTQKVLLQNNRFLNSCITKQGIHFELLASDKDPVSQIQKSMIK